MFGTMITKLFGTTRGAMGTTAARRPSRRFQAGLGLGIDGLEGRLAPAPIAPVAAMIGGMDTGQRDILTDGLPTNADLEDGTEPPVPAPDLPVDLDPTPPPIGEGTPLLA